MREIIHGKVKYYQFETFPESELIHAVFTRQGGVSPEPWDSLNQGGTTGDSRSNVIENRRLAFDCFSLPVESIYDVWQVHGTTLMDTDRPRALDQPHEKADGIITSTRGIVLFMRFADCVPILLYEPTKRVIAILHAGWQGTVKCIANKGVRHMVERYSCDPANILAAIGPSIGPDHYAVQDDVISRVQHSFPNTWMDLVRREGERSYLNLWQANRAALLEAGVKNIEVSEMCTACNLDDWYSHRMQGPRTGRFGVLLALR